MAFPLKEGGAFAIELAHLAHLAQMAGKMSSAKKVASTAC